MKGSDLLFALIRVHSRLKSFSLEGALADMGACGKLPNMSSLSALPNDPKELRPLLHAEVDKLRDDNLLVLHRVALELELDEVTDRLSAGFEADRVAGKLAQLPEIISAARAAVRASQSP